MVIQILSSKKASGKSRMCVDYTDFNIAFPKDSYPFLNIDKRLDNLYGNLLMSLLDAYVGYN